MTSPLMKPTLVGRDTLHELDQPLKKLAYVSNRWGPLLVLRKKVKKLNGREVLYGGLPIESLKQAGIDIGTEAVIELEIIIDFSEWESWRQEQRAQMDDIEEKLPCNPCDDDLLNRRYVRLFLPEAIVNKVMMTKASSSSSDWLLIAVKQAI